MTTVGTRGVAVPLAITLPGFPGASNSAQLDGGGMSVNGGPESGESDFAAAQSPSLIAFGLQLIDSSGLAESTKKVFSLGWRRWASYFAEQGIDPSAVTVEQALDWVPSFESTPRQLLRASQSVNHIYRRMGLASPLHDPSVKLAIATAKLPSDPGILPGSPAWVGVQLIETSSLTHRTKSVYAGTWRQWVNHCQRTGSDPLAVTAEQLLAWVQSGDCKPAWLLSERRGVNFVYQRMGLASPLQGRSAKQALFGRKPGRGTEILPEDPGWTGLQLIQNSGLARRTKSEYANGWRHWVAHFERKGNALLGVTAEEAVAWVKTLDRQRQKRRLVTSAVNFVYREMGLDSPLLHPSVQRALSGGKRRGGTEILPGEPGWSGLQAIQNSSLVQDTKWHYRLAWSRWVVHFASRAIEPLAVTPEETVDWALSFGPESGKLKEDRTAVNFVFRRLGLTSPLPHRAVARGICGEEGADDFEILCGDPGWPGLQVIQNSSLRFQRKREYSLGWERWVWLFRKRGIDPMAVTAEQAMAWVPSAEWTPEEWRSTRRAVNTAYKGLELASPLQERAVLQALCGAKGGALGDRMLSCLRLRESDYLLWCQDHGRTPLPGNGPQVAEFLRYLSEHYGSGSVYVASLAVSKYQEDNGFPGTSSHPLVLEAVKQCQPTIEASCAYTPRQPSRGVNRRRPVYQAQWIDWCETRSIAWKEPPPEYPLRYLEEIKHQSIASDKVPHLSALYQGTNDPFSDERILEWRLWHIQARREGSLPESPNGAAAAVAAVIERMRTAAAARRVSVLVGVTREEVAALDYELSDKYAQSTIKTYAYEWVKFESWLQGRAIPLEEVTGVHVAVFLHEYSQGRRVSTVTGMATALAMVFEELGFADNPAVAAEVNTCLMRLTRQRKERPSQARAFREEHYQAVVANAGRVVEGERPRDARRRTALEPALFGLMFDGMLRVDEAARACWRHVSRHADGSGRLLIEFSKVDQVGEGAYVYVSRRTMESLHWHREVTRALGKPASDSDRVFGVEAAQLESRIKSAFKAAGFQGRFTSHSMRVGMAQELALAGFGLALIMLAGRWVDPGMPAYYTRGIKVD